MRMSFPHPTDARMGESENPGYCGIEIIYFCKILVKNG